MRVANIIGIKNLWHIHYISQLPDCAHNTNRFNIGIGWDIW